MIAASVSPLLAIVASLGGVVAMGASGISQRGRNAIVVIAAAAQVAVLLTMVPEILAGRSIEFTLSPFLPEADIAFRVDGLGLLFALIASVLWLVSAVYAIGYLEALRSPRQARFHALFALTIAFTLGVAFAANLVTLYIFYEAMTVATYFLVTHDDTEEAHAGGRRYLAYHLGTSIAFLLPAIVLTYLVAGHFDFKAGGMFGAIDLEQHRVILTVIFLLFLAGSAKVALMPLHGWLPGAMVAPVPVSALLHAVAVVNAGAYGVVRFMLDGFGEKALAVLGLDQIAIVLASFTVLAASFYALRLDNLKALLAFSTIGQLGYIVLGAALGNEAGATGSMLHILNHGVSKITLFLCAGAIYVATHKKEISEMRGLVRQMPLTVAAFAIGSFSLIGFPLTAGFISKLYLIAGAQQAGSTIALVALIGSSLLSAAYYLHALAIFLDRGNAPSGRPLPTTHPANETDSRMLLPILICAAAIVVLGLVPEQAVMPLLRPVVGASFSP